MDDHVSWIDANANRDLTSNVCKSDVVSLYSVDTGKLCRCHAHCKSGYCSDGHICEAPWLFSPCMSKVEFEIHVKENAQTRLEYVDSCKHGSCIPILSACRFSLDSACNAKNKHNKDFCNSQNDCHYNQFCSASYLCKSLPGLDQLCNSEKCQDGLLCVNGLCKQKCLGTGKGDCPTGFECDIMEHSIVGTCKQNSLPAPPSMASVLTLDTHLGPYFSQETPYQKCPFGRIADHSLPIGRLCLANAECQSGYCLRGT